MLHTLKRSLAARTVALLWIDDDGERVKLKEVASEADDITENPRLASAGVLGAVIRDRAPLLVAATKPGQLPYYTGGRAGVALVAVPIIENGHLRGMLAADRDAPFAEDDRDMLADRVRVQQVLRVVQAERVFRAVERGEVRGTSGSSRRPPSSAARSRSTRSSLRPRLRCRDRDRRLRRRGDRALRAGEGGRHRVRRRAPRRARHRPRRSRATEGPREFKDNAGLASMVVKNRHYPTGRRSEPREVFRRRSTRAEQLVRTWTTSSRCSVLPLLSGDNPIGTADARRANAEKAVRRKDVREMLAAVIANQVAIAVQNGLLYKQMETMATRPTRSTGLTNRRTLRRKVPGVPRSARRARTRSSRCSCATSTTSSK